MTSRRHPSCSSRWLPLAVVLSVALLAQSACTSARVVPFRAEPGNLGKVVAFTKTSGETIPIDRAAVFQDTLFYFTGTVPGSCPIEEVESVTMKKFSAVKTALLIVAISPAALVLVFTVWAYPPLGY